MASTSQDARTASAATALARTVGRNAPASAVNAVMRRASGKAVNPHSVLMGAVGSALVKDTSCESAGSTLYMMNFAFENDYYTLARWIVANMVEAKLAPSKLSPELIAAKQAATAAAAAAQVCHSTSFFAISCSN